MCGICGYISNEQVSLEQLNAMNDTMFHRGPDDHGAELFDIRIESMNTSFTIGMAQRRLSILDLSPLGHQPMHSKDDSVIVVFNGEIYNFMELKEELKQYEFTSTCDTEVIIAAYLEWGIQCVERLNGMFAIAIFDRKRDEFYLVRDRIGKKPLYYWYQEQKLVFASELKPLMVYPGFEKKIRTDILGRYLYHQYINAPDSIFEEVFKLEPGGVLKYKNGQIKTWKYWDVNEAYHRQKAIGAPAYEEAKEELKSILKDAVKNRMIADVPLGTFLSGGYDSSLITALAQESQTVPVKTFSIGFEDKSFNEAIYARKIAKHLGTDHTELYIGEKEMYDLVESIPKYYDEPFADSSQIPSMLVSALAREKVTVALSGDGGDEFFCGYNIYPLIGQAQKLDALGSLTYWGLTLPGIKRLRLMNKLPMKVQIIANNRDKETKTQFGSENYFSLVSRMIKGETLPVRYAVESMYHEKNWQERRMLLDMDTYLPGDILCKVDRASMKYSLETRCPILDTNVMEYSLRLPHEYKSKDGIKKRILKDIAYDYIPKELLDRPKVGFAVPLDRWLRGPLKDQLIDLSGKEMLEEQGIFDTECIKGLLDYYLLEGDKGPATGENYSKFVWSYFVFQKWYEYYMK